jgi:hypothetical protein
MGLVRKAGGGDDVESGEAGSVAAGKPGSVDMSTVIRQAVAAEIERQRLESLQRQTEHETGPSADEDRA